MYFLVSLPLSPLHSEYALNNDKENLLEMKFMWMVSDFRLYFHSQELKKDFTINVREFALGFFFTTSFVMETTKIIDPGNSI